MVAANVTVLPNPAAAGTQAPRLFSGAVEISLLTRLDCVSLMRFKSPGFSMGDMFTRHSDGGLLNVLDQVYNAGYWTPVIFASDSHPDLIVGQDGRYKLVGNNSSKGGIIGPPNVTIGNFDFTLFGIFETVAGDACSLIGANDDSVAYSLAYGSGNNILNLSRRSA